MAELKPLQKMLRVRHYNVVPTQYSKVNRSNQRLVALLHGY